MSGQTLLLLIGIGLLALWFVGRRNRRAPAEGETQAATQTETVPAKRGPQDGMACAKGKGWKGTLGMGACCAGPILLIAAIPLFGGSLSGVASAALPWVALLACPAGMYFMMRHMMKHGAHPPASRTELTKKTGEQPALLEKTRGQLALGDGGEAPVTLDEVLKTKVPLVTTTPNPKDGDEGVHKP